MEKELLDFIHQHKLLDLTKHKVLLAASGGKDSMCLATLFLNCGISFSLIHCNYGLRGSESEEDEIFLRSFAKKNNLEFFSKKFDLKNISNNKSIQKLARDLRYSYFEEIRIKNEFDFIATAHHLNDQTETLIFNITRGTGLGGLHGIPIKRENIIRPLLFAESKQIEQYIFQNKIDFREDSTNSEIKYSRNQIRHNILPEMENLNPNVHQNISHLCNKIKDIEWIINEVVEDLRKIIFSKKGEKFFIDLEKLNNLPKKSFFIYEFFKEFGLSESQIIEFEIFLEKHTGKTFELNNYRILKNRNQLIVEKKRKFIYDEIEITDFNSNSEILEKKIQLKTQERNGQPVLFEKGKLYVDKDLLTLPLKIRTVLSGDKFKPLGMKGQKKVMDFLMGRKVNKFDKSECLVLFSGKTIVGILGLEINENYKITDKTKNILTIEIKK